jgi:hypothetical protein
LGAVPGGQWSLWLKNNIAQQYFTLELRLLRLLRYGKEWLTFMVKLW